MAKQANNDGANLGFEAQLRAAADKLRGNMEPSGYKHIALGWRLAKMNLAVHGIDARKLGQMVDRTRKEFSDADIARIADTYRTWRGAPDAAPYEDKPGFCKSATLGEIREHNHVLMPSCFVGAAAAEDDGEAFAEKMARLAAKLRDQQTQEVKLDAAIVANLEALGFGSTSK